MKKKTDIEDLDDEILTQVAEERARRANDIPPMEEEIKNILKREGIEATISSRLKSVERIIEKLALKNTNLDGIVDIAGIRIITKKPEDCYVVLEALHSKYRFRSDEFDDYIKNPKPNSYQSLHTTIITKTNNPIEVQIRTEKMHKHAEMGLASHKEYKIESKKKINEMIMELIDEIRGK